jgi:hypothetical protein
LSCGDADGKVWRQLLKNALVANWGTISFQAPGRGLVFETLLWEKQGRA